MVGGRARVCASSVGLEGEVARTTASGLVLDGADQGLLEASRVRCARPVKDVNLSVWLRKIVVNGGRFRLCVSLQAENLRDPIPLGCMLIL